MYSEEFKKFITICEENKEYVGLGNPNAKILFVGKEAGMEVEKETTHGSAKSWSENDYSKRFTPEDEKLRNGNHTWQKYQKLYELILDNLDVGYYKDDEKEITFVEDVFTTELNNLHAPNTSRQKEEKDLMNV